MLPNRSTLPTKVLILITEDWFLLSHFKPVIRALIAGGHDVAVATAVSTGTEMIEALGARVIPFNFSRASQNPLRQVALVLGLRKLMRFECPSVVHAIALKPIVLGGLALSTRRPAQARPALIMHLTGVGFVGTTTGTGRIFHTAALRLIAHFTQRSDTVLLVENPDDAIQVLPDQERGYSNVVVLGGAGVDLDQFPATKLPTAIPPSAGYVGRMVWTKGVDVLVDAHRRLKDRNVALNLRLSGLPDTANPRPVSKADLTAWGQTAGITWLGHSDDIADFWRHTNIAVVPSRGGEGMPRAMLEAAACGRPLIVSDVPGCRQFVRHQVEGLVIPPGNAAALADALECLVRNPDLAATLGRNARARVAEGFTETHVEKAVTAVYQQLLSPHD